jgi:hypothetical protein
MGGMVIAIGVIVDALFAVFAVYFSSPNRVRHETKPVPRARRPKLYRPVQRYKSKIRGIGVGVRVEDLGVVEDKDGNKTHMLVGRDRKNYVRFYPNFGFTVRGYHWCRKGKH